MNKHLAKEILNKKFEHTGTGEIYLPKSKVFIGGAFITSLNGEDESASGNIVVDEGLNYILDAAVSNEGAEANWYIAIYSNNYTPIAADVAATIAGAGKSDEITTQIDEATRPAFILPAGATAGKLVENTASPAVFTANTSVNAYGAFLISDNTKGGGLGTLLAASKFAAVRAMVNTDVLNVTYQLQIADA